METLLEPQERFHELCAVARSRGGQGVLDLSYPNYHDGPDEEVRRAFRLAVEEHLSLQLCETWQWRQPNGMPCDAICRGLLLWLHRAGHIQLPPPQWTTRKAWRPRMSAPPILIDTTPIATSLGALDPFWAFTNCAAPRRGALQQRARVASL